MDIKILKQKLDYYKIPETWYCIGGEAQYCDCMLYEDGRWIIFNMERGKRKRIREFQTEEEACQYLYDMEMYIMQHEKEMFEKRQNGGR